MTRSSTTTTPCASLGSAQRSSPAAAFVGLAHAASVVTFAFLTGGCVIPSIILPFASPPLRGAVSFGTASGSIRSEPGTTGTAADRIPGSALVDVHASVQPFQLRESYTSRGVDLGLGYHATVFLPIGAPAFVYHGPYLEAALLPIRLWDVDHHSQVRVNLALSGELLYAALSRGTETGVGATLSATFEIVGFMHGARTSTTRASGTGAVLHGEGGMGLQLALSGRSLNGELFWVFSIGWAFRAPASAGYLLVDTPGLFRREALCPACPAS
jgi:hypothetical protein